MACGKAVVLSRLPVFEEYYTDGEDCLMCESRTDFRDALDRLAAAPDLRDRLGENARATAREHGLDRVGDRLVGIYRDVVEGHPDGAASDTAGDEGQTV
jgi:glycosyltransferase involved in cell wall biosynthesis